MPIPTTRKARFQFYKNRAIKRRRIVEHYQPHDSIIEGRRSGLTKRPWLWKHLPKQMPRVSPKIWLRWWAPRQWEDLYLVEPFWGVPAVLDFDPPPVPHWGPNTHYKYAALGYVHKRVKHFPRFRSLERGPYLGPKGAITEGNCYMWPTYPSGQQSYASKQGWV